MIPLLWWFLDAQQSRYNLPIQGCLNCWSATPRFSQFIHRSWWISIFSWWNYHAFWIPNFCWFRSRFAPLDVPLHVVPCQRPSPGGFHWRALPVTAGGTGYGRRVRRSKGAAAPWKSHGARAPRRPGSSPGGCQAVLKDDWNVTLIDSVYLQTHPNIQTSTHLHGVLWLLILWHYLGYSQN